MAKLKAPPAYDLIAETTGKASRAWLEFFDNVFRGDQGQAWTPTFTGLTTVGTPTITGSVYQWGALVKWWVKIVPGTNTSSTSGTTYINNFPLRISVDDFCVATTNAPSAVLGMVEAATNRIYVPSWSLITSSITITGTAVAS